MIRVVIPQHLQTLAALGREIELDVRGPVTLERTCDALEERYPVLRGTFRDRVSGKRRPFIRFYACEKDLSHEPPDTVLPDPVTAGREPLYVVGAMAGG